MPLRYLFGPVTASFADQNLGPQRAAGSCLAFNAEGEWATPQVMAVQFQGVSGNGLDQFKDPKTEVILWPKKYATGKIVYPYNPGS